MFYVPDGVSELVLDGFLCALSRAGVRRPDLLSRRGNVVEERHDVHEHLADGNGGAHPCPRLVDQLLDLLAELLAIARAGYEQVQLVRQSVEQAE